MRFIDFKMMCVKSVIYCCDRDNVLLWDGLCKNENKYVNTKYSKI